MAITMGNEEFYKAEIARELRKLTNEEFVNIKNKLCKEIDAYAEESMFLQENGGHLETPSDKEVKRDWNKLKNMTLKALREDMKDYFHQDYVDLVCQKINKSRISEEGMVFLYNSIKSMCNEAKVKTAESLKRAKKTSLKPKTKTMQLNKEKGGRGDE